jgi:hypothetical protein
MTKKTRETPRQRHGRDPPENPKGETGLDRLSLASAEAEFSVRAGSTNISSYQDMLIFYLQPRLRAIMLEIAAWKM